MSNEDPSATERVLQQLDRTAVSRTLHQGREWLESGVAATSSRLRRVSVAEVTWLEWALVSVFGILIGVRLLPYREVFQNGGVVLTGNDPYRIRYWVEQFAAEYAGVFDLSILSTLPEGVATVDPLTVLTLWWFTELFGGGATAAGWVLALYPVVSAVVTAWFVYRIATRLGDDPRVGVAAVGLLAVAPGHAFRTGLGFADHHAFDYPWLSLTVLALVALVDADLTDRRAWRFAAVLGVAVTGQTLAWQASPLLLAPLAGCIGLYGLFAVRAGRSGVLTLVSIAAGLLFAAVTTALVRMAFGWPISAVAYAPGLLLLGTVGVTLAAAVVVRADRSTPTLAGLYVAGAAGLAGLAQSLGRIAPAVTADLVGYVERGVSYFASFQTDAFGEAQPLTAQFGPIAGPLIMLGYSLFLGLPVTLWAVWRAYDRNEPGWLLVSVYVWYFAAASLLQRRFTGELAPLLAVPAGLGLLYLLSQLALVRPVALFRSDDDAGAIGDTTSETPSSNRRRAVILGSITFVIGFFPVLFTAFIHDDLTIEERMYDAAAWMQEYAADREWAYPENYVFSSWGRNRVYNYYVSGESRSYWFAKRRFREFLTSSPQSSSEWYEELRDRVGFVVTREGLGAGGIASVNIYTALHRYFGSGAGRLQALEHYRAVYASGDGGIKVFTLVPGVTLTGTGPAETELTLSTTVQVPGAEFQYSRAIQTDGDGAFEVTVPHPGEYTLGGTTVSVSEEAVRGGGTVEVEAVSGD